jgi:hypothetical protein
MRGKKLLPEHDRPNAGAAAHCLKKSSVIHTLFKTSSFSGKNGERLFPL